MHTHETSTAYGLAVKHGLDFWPGRCPSCGDTTQHGRVLDDEPGRDGRARYFCRNCKTTFERTLLEVGRYVRWPR